MPPRRTITTTRRSSKLDCHPTRPASPRSTCRARGPEKPTTRVTRRASSHQQARVPYRTADIPLAIWPCAQKTSQWQRRGRYLPASNRHPAKMLPTLARRAIETYSDPGDVVLDPMCGIGTTVIEAIHQGRKAIGVEFEARWAKVAAENIEHAHNQGARSSAHIVQGDARDLPQLLAATGHRRARDQRTAPGRTGKFGRLAHGRVDLILTSPPYGCGITEPEPPATIGDGPVSRKDTSNYGPDRRSLGHARGHSYLTAMADIYSVCAELLKPGGFLVLVTKDMRSQRALRNLSGETITLCQDLGLLYWQRIIGLLASVRDTELLMRGSLWQILAPCSSSESPENAGAQEK